MLGKYLVGLFLFWGLGGSFFYPIQTVSASSNCSSVIINEIMPNPASPLSDSTDEWFELKNTTDVETDISGCKVRDMKGTVREYTFSPGTLISAKGFIVFYNRDTKISLNNDEDGLQLVGEGVVSQTELYKNAPDTKSFSFNGSGWEWTDSITPGFEKTNLPAETIVGPNTCEGLIVSEVMPDPKSPFSDAADEWIEIYNESAETINLSGCTLADTYKPGSTHEYLLPSINLAPGNFMVFYSKETKISLNNSDGDSVRILSSDKKIMFETQNYGKAKAGQSWAYDGDKWFWTVASTAGALNIIEEGEETSDSAVKKKSTKEKATSIKSKSKSKPLSKKSLTSRGGTNGAEVLGANSEEDSMQGKVNDKVLGYILVGLSAVLLVGYIVWINKDFLYENTIKKLSRNG